jgi:hypothetical protein
LYLYRRWDVIEEENIMKQIYLLFIGLLVTLTLLIIINNSREANKKIKSDEGTETTAADSSNRPLNLLDRQKVLLKFPVRDVEDKNTWIQGASVNQEDKEIYTTRQSNGGTFLVIERRDLETGKIKELKPLWIQAGSYAEGLPWFKNSVGDLLFLIRQSPEGKMSIFNYTKDEIQKTFNLLGSTKIGFDPDKKYLVTSNWVNGKFDTLYVYHFDSVTKGAPKLFKTLSINGDLFFEKPQGMTIYDGKILISHGGRGGNPAISVVNMSGEVEEVFSLDRKEYANMINKNYPKVIKDTSNFDYENEGIFMYEINGDLIPALVQIVNYNVYIVLAGIKDGEQIKRID